ncbi:MAG: hypothetical protein QM696_12185 [Steroidobacteraceae bacterium]
MNKWSGPGYRIAIAAIAALLMAGPLRSATPPLDCGALCAQWVLDEGSGGNVDALLDTALADYREPKPRHMNRPPPTLEGLEQADLERSLGPITDRPGKAELRRELQRLLRIPARLSIAVDGRDVLLAEAPEPPRRLSPGEPHARVDSLGTAEIRTVLRNARLTVSESYDSRRSYTQTYSVQRGNGRLIVVHEVRRPGLKPLRLQVTYRPEPAATVSR